VPTETCTTDCAAYRRRPASLPLEFVQGDDFAFSAVINRDLAGHTLAASIVNASTGSTVCTFTTTSTPVTVSGATHARVGFSLSDTQTALVVGAQTYRWSFRWTTPGGDTRTILAGRVVAMRR
jgi:hypothetical protein